MNAPFAMSDSVDRRPLPASDVALTLPFLYPGTVLLLRQHRHAIGKSILELPGGRIEVGETPLAAAARELREETGFHPQAMEHLGSYYPVPALLSYTVHLFVATGLHRSAGDVAHEDIEQVLLDWPALVDHVLAGDNVDAALGYAVLRTLARRHGDG